MRGRFRYSFWRNGGLVLKPAVIIICLLFNSLLLTAQNIDNLQIEKVQDEGLTSGDITCINQDKNGFMWFGTGDGLFRYDGYSFKAFRSFAGDQATLISNWVFSICPDNNNLWVGTVNGVSCVDINTQKITNIYATQPLQIEAIVAKDSSALWIATPVGLYELNKTTLSLTYVPAVPKNNAVIAITDDHTGHLYLSSINGFYRYTVATGASKFYPLNLPTYPSRNKNTPVTIGHSMLDNIGNLWMGTWDAGLVRFNTKTEKTDTWFHPTDDVNFLPYKIVMNILPDKYGNIWLANKEGGLTIFNPSKNKFTNYPVEWKSDNKISDAVISLFRDRSGIVWLGTQNGVFKYDPHHVYLSKEDLYLKTDTGIVPAHISPLVMFKDKDGLLWMGMYEGIFTLDQKTGILRDCNQLIGLPKQFTFAAFNMKQGAGGAIWMTAKNMLVKVTKKSTLDFKAEIFKTDDIKSTICSLLIDKESRIWLGTHSDGIFRFDPVTKKFSSCHFEFKSQNSRINEARSFCELSKDSLLIGSTHSGLLLLHVNSGRYEKIRLNNPGNQENNLSIGGMYKKGNELWIAVDNKGLWQTNTAFARPFVEATNDGLPTMQINSITGDKQNNIWLLSSAGAIKLEGKKITVFDKRDGIQNLNELNAMIADGDNNILIGSRGVIYLFNPASIIKNETPPKVLITDMRVFDKDYTIRKGEVIKLDYNQNYFTFQYVALNYTQSRLNKYAYRMDGLDKGWIYTGSNRNVSYANLQEGTYTFYVKACNNEGVWNDIPAKLTLVISPPFWHRWWFYTLIIAFISGSVFILYWYNMSQFKMRLELRNKIAQDLHDDIGSTLSGINIFSKIALQKLRRNEGGSSELLEKISDRSEKTMDALSDIVWSISTKNDHIDNFLVKAREYLAELLEPQGIRYEMNIAEDISYLKLGMELRKEFYLIFKEAICNASKYAHCSLVVISLKKEKELISLIIRDNGVGFDMEKITIGNGLPNMQHRAQKMKAKLDIISEAGAGTSIILSFSIPRFR